MELLCCRDSKVFEVIDALHLLVIWVEKESVVLLDLLKATVISLFHIIVCAPLDLILDLLFSLQCISLLSDMSPVVVSLANFSIVSEEWNGVQSCEEPYGALVFRIRIEDV